MSVTIAIAVDDKSWKILPLSEYPEYNLYLSEDEGYFWFLEPFFNELNQKTGQYIDPWGYAEFSGEDLLHLQDTLGVVRTVVDKQVEQTWQVQLPMQLPNDEGKILQKTVSKRELCKILNQLQNIVTFALKAHKRVVSLGD